MKYSIFPILVLISLLISACGNDEPTDQTKVIRMSVSNETGFIFGMMSEPQECMLVMSEDNPGIWEPLAFGAIEGFTYEREHEYYLDVKRTILATPPQDGSGRKYTLVRILEDRHVIEAEKPTETEIKKEEDIEYYDLCPIEKYRISEVFEVDDSGLIFYRDSQTTGMTYNACRIWFEVILDKEDPDYLQFSSTSYMAIYSYILSPLSDEIKRVYNESHGPMFKNVIPPEEFDYICTEMKSGEELHYSLILANIHKKGLQKLEFSVKKK